MTRVTTTWTIGACFLAVGLLVAARADPVAQGSADPSLAPVLSRAAAYVDGFARQFMTVVAEERYTQKAGRVRRTLRSDLVLVQPADSDEWMPFRDVFEVDGKAVRDRDQRVKRLFIDSPATAIDAAKRIEQESARFCLGPFYRETADPTLPLLFLDGRNQPRFDFRLDGEDTIERQRALRVRYSERAVPTIIQYEGFDAPASGTLWIEGQTGRLMKGTVRALLRYGRRLTRFEIEVTFKPSDAVGLWAPAELHERFEWGTGELVGVATYSNFRRFETGARIVVPR